MWEKCGTTKRATEEGLCRVFDVTLGRQSDALCRSVVTGGRVRAGVSIAGWEASAGAPAMDQGARCNQTPWSLKTSGSLDGR